MNKFILSLFIVFLFGCNADYSKDLGGGYTLERTNACCVFIVLKDDNLKLTTGIPKGREIKPKIKKIWYNHEIIIGYKEKNTCCYLDRYETENPNGYFLIDKKLQEIYDGLNRIELQNIIKKYNVEVKEIKFKDLS